MGYKGLSPWVILCCFPSNTSREFAQKWNSLDRSWSSYGVPALHVAVYHSILWYWRFFHFIKKKYSHVCSACLLNLPRTESTDLPVSVLTCSTQLLFCSESVLLSCARPAFALCFDCCFLWLYIDLVCHSVSSSLAYVLIYSFQWLYSIPLCGYPVIQNSSLAIVRNLKTVDRF